MEFSIRSAIPRDAAFLPEIERSSGQVFRALPDLAWIADDAVLSEGEHLSFMTSGAIWVSDSPSDGIVGFITTQAAPDALHIWQMAVRHDAQGRGIGRALLDAAIAGAGELGLRAATLTTFRDVPWNAPFYEKSNFHLLHDVELNERLANILKTEIAHGLPGEKRCAMRRYIV